MNCFNFRLFYHSNSEVLSCSLENLHLFSIFLFFKDVSRQVVNKTVLKIWTSFIINYLSLKLRAIELLVGNCAFRNVKFLPVFVTLRDVSLETVLASIRRLTRRTDVRHSLVYVLRRKQIKKVFTIRHSKSQTSYLYSFLFTSRTHRLWLGHSWAQTYITRWLTAF